MICWRSSVWRVCRGNLGNARAGKEKAAGGGGWGRRSGGAAAELATFGGIIWVVNFLDNSFDFSCFDGMNGDD